MTKKGTNMNKITLAGITVYACVVTISGMFPSQSALAVQLGEALTSGSTKLDLRLRYETVDQKNPLENASALTLRTRLGYTTGATQGFSATIEMEDNRIVLGQGDYSVPPTGYQPGQYSVIADPEFTELDQGFIQFQSEPLNVKLGRQVIALDNHRFVGHVGWRQDRQTFDAISAEYRINHRAKFYYAYILQRNRIFAQDTDLDAKDHLFNGSYVTSAGIAKAYGYVLEVDNGSDNSLDTFGVSFSGSRELSTLKALYAVEYASQSADSPTTSFNADYIMLEAGMVLSGVTAKLTYEKLGSDEGQYGFSTPLATLHKFNGWSDQFLSTPQEGLIDIQFSLAGKNFDGNWLLAYHDFKADQASPVVDDLGSEINVQYTRKFAKYYSAGIKYASYSGGSNKVDTDKLWVWVGAGF